MWSVGQLCRNGDRSTDSASRAMTRRAAATTLTPLSLDAVLLTSASRVCSQTPQCPLRVTERIRPAAHSIAAAGIHLERARAPHDTLLAMSAPAASSAAAASSSAAAAAASSSSSSFSWAFEPIETNLGIEGELSSSGLQQSLTPHCYFIGITEQELHNAGVVVSLQPQPAWRTRPPTPEPIYKPQPICKPDPLSRKWYNDYSKPLPGGCAPHRRRVLMIRHAEKGCNWKCYRCVVPGCACSCPSSKNYDGCLPRIPGYDCPKDTVFPESVALN